MAGLLHPLFLICLHTPHQDPADNRRRYLDNDQLLKLARLHQWILTVDVNGTHIDSIQQLETRITELEAKLGY
jgi:hypothetical protein